MRFFGLVLVALLFTACEEAKISRPGPDITFSNGALLYKGDRFTGIVSERFEQVGTIRETHYESGLPHGEQREFTEDGKILVARRHYTRGENSGVHDGWFLDGKRRFHYEYENGRSHGEFWEWHNSGHPSMFAKFENGTLVGKKMWREDGKIYMNYVFPKGKPYGTPGTKLCFQVRDDKGNKSLNAFR